MPWPSMIHRQDDCGFQIRFLTAEKAEGKPLRDRRVVEFSTFGPDHRVIACRADFKDAAEIACWLLDSIAAEAPDLVEEVIEKHKFRAEM